MEITDPTRRVLLDAAIDRSMIRGTRTAPTGERRDFHGWLELSTALEAMLDPGAARRARMRESNPRSEPRGTVPTPERRETGTKAGMGDDSSWPIARRQEHV